MGTVTCNNCFEEVPSMEVFLARINEGDYDQDGSG